MTPSTVIKLTPFTDVKLKPFTVVKLKPFTVVKMTLTYRRPNDVNLFEIIYKVRHYDVRLLPGMC